MEAIPQFGMPEALEGRGNVRVRTVADETGGRLQRCHPVRIAIMRVMRHGLNEIESRCGFVTENLRRYPKGLPDWR
jgi:hypothetical protein